MSQNVKWCFCPPEESTDTQESNDYDVQLSSHSIVRKWSELPESITIPRGQVSMTSLPPPPSNNWHKDYLSFGTPVSDVDFSELFDVSNTMIPLVCGSSLFSTSLEHYRVTLPF
jgi:hypothetical protein